ncbi:MAG: hypothetical protein QOE65_1511, partial [Solirubrobacteraceae bacterium]|nr:hypothetical protein [Solirubrobacteraceae bacterium]
MKKPGNAATLEAGERTPLRPLPKRSLAPILGLLAALLAAGTAQAAVSLYPDMETLPPRELALDRTDVSPDKSGVMHNVLRFSNSTWNNGEGRLEVRAQIDPTTHEGPALQRIYDTAGNYADFNVGKLYFHAVHNHYHFDNWGTYQLWTRSAWDSWIASGRAIGSAQYIGSKTTSCIMDEELVRQLANTPYPPVFPFSGCGSPNASGLLVEGLSPGWADTYDASRAEQWIDLDQQALPDGDYVLRSVADPDNHVYESPAKADDTRESQVDNEAITPFRIAGGQLVDSNAPDAPTVTINHVDEETSSPDVTVSVLGRDDVSGVDQVRLSNDGNQWKTLAYSAPDTSTPQDIAWNLSDPAYGGTAGGGTHTVFAQVRDRTGRWSDSGNDTIALHNGSIASYAAAVSADAPAGWWRLGETTGTAAGDSAGGNPGAYRNGVGLGAASLLTSDAANGAATFDGVNDYVNVPDAVAVSPTTRMSLEAWIKPASLPAAGSFRSVATKEGSFSLQFNGPRLEFTIIQAGARRRALAPAGAIVAGQTYHVVGTYDGTFSHLYVNGSQLAELSVSGDATDTTAPLTIGAWSATDEFMPGTIDDVALYPTALSPARIQAHYTSGTNAAPEAVPAPGGLAATPGPGRIDLSWSDNSSNETGFVVERDTDSGFSAPTKFNLGPNTTTLSDTGLPKASKYYYRVRAFNPTDTSGWSNVASATTPDPVAAPSALSATPASPTRVDLAWADNSTNETSFVIERSATSTFTAPTTFTVAANVTTYADSSVAGATTYYYRVKARNATDTSPPSNTAPAATPAPPPPPPSAYADAVKADAPVSYWRLSEASGTAAADLAGASPGTYVNGAVLGAPGLLGADPANKAVTFDGVNDHVRIADAAALKFATVFSLEAWIKPGAVPAAGSFASVLTKEGSYAIQFNGPKLELTVMQAG